MYKNGKVEIIQNEQGNRITPSVVAFTPEGRLVGDGAKNQAVLNPSNTIYDVKRLIGRAFHEAPNRRHRRFSAVLRGGAPTTRHCLWFGRKPWSTTANCGRLRCSTRTASR